VELISAVNMVNKFLGDHVGDSLNASEIWQAWFTVRAKTLEAAKPAYNNARDEMLPGCSGCKHIAHDQTLDTYPCRGCIRVRRTDLFDAGSTSHVA